VTVLLPVRDGARHLLEAIASIEAQTLAELEVIAVDDGSSDETPDLLHAWAARDRRVRVLRQEPSGIVAALERARAEARGRYLARMDADDIALPGRLAAQLELMERHPDLAACGTLVEYFPRGLVRDGARRYEAWINAAVTPDQIERALFVECPLAHPTFFLRADAVEAVGGYRDRGWPEDYDLLLRLWAGGGRLGKVPETLMRWREGERRLSRTDHRYAPAAFRACKAHHLSRTLLRDRDAVIWGAGPVGKSLSRALALEGVGLDAFVDLDPRKIGQEIHGAPVVDTQAGLARLSSYHLAAVGQPGARRRLQALLTGAGLVEMADFVAVA
jgi:glycosyltransferase involved in cell wall biosynthesis